MATELRALDEKKKSGPLNERTVAAKQWLALSKKIAAQEATYRESDAGVKARLRELDEAKAALTDMQAAQAREDEKQRVAANAAEVAAKQDELKKSILAQRDGLIVVMLDYGVGTVMVKGVDGFDGVGATKEQYLWVSLGLINKHKTRKAEYSSWRGKMISVEPDYATAVDDAENVLRRIDVGFGKSVVGGVEEASIYPGKSTLDVLVFQRPVDSAKRVKIEAPGRNIGSDKPVNFELQLSPAKLDHNFGK